EHRLGPGQELLLPGVDQGRVDPELGGQLVDRPVTPDGGQGDLGLERRRVGLPLRHRTTSGNRQSSLTGGPKSGVHYSPSTTTTTWRGSPSCCGRRRGSRLRPDPEGLLQLARHLLNCARNWPRPWEANVIRVA